MPTLVWTNTAPVAQLRTTGTIQVVAIQGSVGITVSAQAQIQNVAMTGAVEISLHATRPADWPDAGETAAWELYAQQFQYSAGVGFAPVLPVPSFHAEGDVSAIGALTITMPTRTVKFSGYQDPQGVLDIKVPNPSFSARSLVGAVGTLNVSMPILSVSLGAELYESGVLDIPVPMPTVVFSGHLSAEGTLSVTIPMSELTMRGTPSEYVDSAGDRATTLYRNMVMNLKNLALTEFKNYDFNSLCRFNGKHLGATATKIYDLDTGTTDEGTGIEWNFRFGYIDLEQKIKKKIVCAWLSYKSDGNLIATIITPAGDQWEYAVDAVNDTEDGIRVKFGKGIRSRYVALDVRNVDGSTLTMDTVRILYDQFPKRR